MISTSPLRYPGGKARFTKFIAEAILSSGEQAKVFVEPFCGGAGVSIALLDSDKVERIALNDSDPLVSSFWKVVFGKCKKSAEEVNWLIGQVEAIELSIKEWRRQKALKPRSRKELAWKCLFLNRTSFNGILYKAGPIGGWKQKNRTLDVRFNREKLIKRLVQLHEMRERVEKVDCLGWAKFCSGFQQTKGVYMYFDPPYYHGAEQLYGDWFSTKDHLSMRNYLMEMQTPWMLSYDDAPEVRALYSNITGINGRVIDQTYSTHPMGGASFIGRELFFSNRSLPIKTERFNKPHVGMSVVGCFKSVKSSSLGPMRTPTKKLHVEHPLILNKPSNKAI